ncbi:MAG: hypothetical protein Pars2KO_09390 [Parasphingorhabdus sp.]
MRKFLFAGTAMVAMALSSPVLAQTEQQATVETPAEQGANELEAFTKMFQNVIEKDDTPIDPAMLAKGARIAKAVVPKGSYRKIMAETFKKVVEPMMEGVDQIPLSVIANFAGVGEEDIKLKEGAKLSDLMEIMDPYYKQRNRTMMTKLTDIMIDLSDDIEPSIRDGMAKAYARRFSAKDLEAVAAFYETESGAKIAGESLGIFASPEVMSASMEMMPKFMERFFGEMEAISKGSEDLPPPRKFSDLSDEELDKMSELMGVARGSMGGGDIEELSEIAEEIAEDLDEESAWNDPENWTAADREAVEKLEAESDAAFNTYYDALEKAREKAKAKLKK